MPPITTRTLNFDIVVFGGGIAGLWILNRLCNEGYNAVLFESKHLGAGQTIASQGMIHGGVKYTLSGALSNASETIADMPDYWRSCLTGQGDVDLSKTQTLSDHFYMWSTESTLSKITSFFASKALRGRVNALNTNAFPPVFNTTRFKGNLYQLVDSVIDTSSLLTNLAQNVNDRIFTIDWSCAQLSVQNNRSTLNIRHNAADLAINAQQFIFSAGRGNENLLRAVAANKPEMQLRPLQQVMVKHDHNHFLYAHCIGTDSTPRLTISSHRCADGKMCWYLGGQLAEQGVNKSSPDLIKEARSELINLFPWLDWSNALWATLPITRAEPKQKNLVRPDKSFIDRVYSKHNDLPFENVLVAWPTKLTLAPNLGNETLALLKTMAVKPLHNNTDLLLLDFLPQAEVAKAPWETAQWQAMEQLL